MEEGGVCGRKMVGEERRGRGRERKKGTDERTIK